MKNAITPLPFGKTGIIRAFPIPSILYFDRFYVDIGDFTDFTSGVFEGSGNLSVGNT